METTAASPTSAGRPATPPGPGRRRPATATIAPEFSARLEYQPLGVVGAIGPWNYPAAAICVLAA
ncbi:MAG TPA: aldehyde dehydrogenase family protein [Actinomycetota bacterium]|nr:aldehyde dehydrogenase family protein [Actinomycetota bacterium]